MTTIFVRTGISFADRSAALAHIGREMVKQGVVQESYPRALMAREAQYPTGIMLDKYAIAIPHCEANHAKSAAIYLLRPNEPVSFQQADDDNDVAAALIIALIVENPAEQLILLRRLFGKLQQTEVIETLLSLPDARLQRWFRETILECDD